MISIGGGTTLTTTSVESKLVFPMRNQEATERSNNNKNNTKAWLKAEQPVSSIVREMTKRPGGRPTASKN